MVAYSFQPSFVAPIVAGTKRQTIRQPRRRHARPGERIQLYQGLRTRACRKIIPDPVGVDEVRIDLRKPLVWEDCPAVIEINGIPISSDDLDAYARADGFRDWQQMERWWRMTHGSVLFVGAAIRWEDRP